LLAQYAILPLIIFCSHLISNTTNRKAVRFKVVVAEYIGITAHVAVVGETTTSRCTSPPVTAATQTLERATAFARATRKGEKTINIGAISVTIPTTYSF